MDADALAARAAAWGKVPGGADEAMRDCARAAVAFVGSLPSGRAPWTDTVALGATMLTARLYRRRNSPAGIESMTELGTSYVSRYDSDIARMLRIDAFMGPVAV